MQLAFKHTKYSFFSFTFLWTFATLIGFLLSLFLIEIGEKEYIGVMEATIGGLAIALPQSYILKQKIFPLGWILSTLLGWALIVAIGIGAVGWCVPSTELLPMRIFLGIISGGTGGFVIGLTQWWLAIPQSVPWTWCWMFVSSASWAVAVPLGSILGLSLRRFTRLFFGEVVGLVLTWLVVGILTGISAYKLFKITPKS
ncbi:hypothetical protein H6G54_15705 [Anabaena cylindrica FACHB-243]|uniref:Uncharacterized protein n=1 Tax=Anabaena cylindrica (strain ATCC 27899 / PCC 7122) TaxID=272123 RepID=K9ZFV8_ANACC|nr:MULTISPECIES: hypothetical protein [Anabaena]AFZ58108.1 hypothetical protein Anacy_2671 [Anabaena cylindrica PCC 7122]MBD2419117.1 hypothetical protein [Anabaena cylindrica FACHB-243]MBY5280674.1 hypothetical protein [Anabaena sp. CCAP 1446/1C]MBY5310584.1 hypothetical protein [Anabaena sp. CCAP 1446/1C]MCM2409587.1 hypothetical protein [Anabaena sp. CCAP 1446/1C]